LGVEKQTAGFKYGRYTTAVIRTCGEIEVNGRKYKLVFLRTNDGQYYYSIRLYNPRGHFIKQMLFEPSALGPLKSLFISEAKKGGEIDAKTKLVAKIKEVSGPKE